jgi:DNA-binding MarR family transcriptional regulator
VTSEIHKTDLTWTAEQLATVGPACAALNVRKASRTLTRLYAKAFEPVKLEPTQFALLVTCSRQSVITMTTLATRLLMDPSGLARNVAVLERRGLLKVVPAEEDRRVRNISITKAGKATLARALPHWESAQKQLADQMGHDRLLLAVDLVKAMTRTGETLLTPQDD